ncbi:MAG: bifunctional glutamate N-acetyltransferase/amino-acid acetyltransferase ArgJ [Micrococcales bacterium]|nr:bifunctional glutamate N-acetyltransferase/amino-acid acetyltransferase ArgJ [Micrococcales bacterium]
MSITDPQGFRAAGYAAGLKASNALDLAVVVNDGPQYVGAAVTTPNRFAAAPVYLTRDVAAGGRVRAVILNSGCANACTGERGRADAARMAELTAQSLEAEPSEVMVCSTGLIGSHLRMDLLATAIPEVCRQASDDGGDAAAQAIMTTDTVDKQAAREGAGGYRIGGMAKGAGMLNPAMATMLSVLTTDAVITPDLAREALAAAVGPTFNRMDSDGCQSTNDTVILLCSGASGVSAEPAEFTENLTALCADLVRQMLADAEGASHTIAVRVRGAASEAAAEAGARAVTSSNLVKAAIFGRDPNWGRILAALGTLDEETCPYDADSVTVAINGTVIFAAGAPSDSTPPDLSGHDVSIDIDLASGAAEATVFTNDLTHDYVEENSAYST